MRKLLLIAGVVCGTGLQAGPITSSTALPVNTGQFIFRSQFQMTRAGDDPGPADRDLRVIEVPNALVYGVNERTALFGVLPCLDKRMELNTGPGRSTRGDAGLGDARAWLRQTIWQEDRLGETRRLAPFIGLKLPTGRSDAADSQGRLPRPLQLGSGSWDPFVGLVFTRQTLDWEFDASASYQHNTRADAFRFGDMFRADASFQKRVWPRELNAGVPAFFYGVAGKHPDLAGRESGEESYNQCMVIRPPMWISVRPFLRKSYQANSVVFMTSKHDVTAIENPFWMPLMTCTNNSLSNSMAPVSD